MNENRESLSLTIAMLMVLTVAPSVGCAPAIDNNNGDTQGKENDNSTGPVNTPPIADAGPDQTVEPGEVQLDGNASSDPNGDTLSYGWEQIAGEMVELSGTGTATPTFIAPNVDETLTFQLVVDDGKGGTSSDSVDVLVTFRLSPQLFIANFSDNSITSYRNPSTIHGNVPPDTSIRGNQTQLDQPSDVIVNDVGELVVTNFRTPSTTFYSEAANLEGNIAPSRELRGEATLLSQPVSLAMNTAQSLLFVADRGGNQILVYEQATAPALGGNIAPLHAIQAATPGDRGSPFGMVFAPNDDLYIADEGAESILVFSDASNLNGDSRPRRIITSAVLQNVLDVFIVDDDNMLVVDFSGQIFAFRGASSLDGDQLPDSILTVNGAAGIVAITVDKAGTGYVADFNNNAVYIFDNIATREGTVDPDRTVQGDHTQLSGPMGVFLLEQ